jgi:hypothetical protein
MSKLVTEPLEIASETGLIAGRILSIDDQDGVLVDYPGNMIGPIPALILEDLLPISRKRVGSNVLLAFGEKDFARPIILGFICDPVVSAFPEKEIEFQHENSGTAVLDGKRVSLLAYEEIRMTCGKASILIRKDGKIILKGTEIVSRAKGTNKIRGSSVQIN